MVHAKNILLATLLPLHPRYGDCCCWMMDGWIMIVANIVI